MIFLYFTSFEQRKNNLFKLKYLNIKVSEGLYSDVIFLRYSILNVITKFTCRSPRMVPNKVHKFTNIIRKKQKNEEIVLLPVALCLH